MEVKEQELINRMPKSYRDINYKSYIYMQDNIIQEQPEGMELEEFQIYQTYAMLSILLDTPISELEQVSYACFIQLIEALKFLDQPIVLSESAYKLKDVDTLTFKDFQTLIKAVEDPYSNMDDILSIITIDLTADQINNLSIYEVMCVMGKLMNSLKKSLLRSQRSLGWTLMKISVRTMMKKVVSWTTFWKMKKKSITAPMVGLN